MRTQYTAPHDRWTFRNGGLHDVRIILPRADEEKFGIFLYIYATIHQMCEFSAARRRRFPFPGKGALAGH